MVGRELENFDATHDGASDVGEAVLRVRDFSLPGSFEDVSLDVAPGEVVGLAGLVGAGRSELLEAIFGLHRRARAGRGRRPRGAVPQPARRDLPPASASCPPTASCRGSCSR